MRRAPPKATAMECLTDRRKVFARIRFELRRSVLAKVAIGSAAAN
jgi:hypothetical protein